METLEQTSKNAYIWSEEIKSRLRRCIDSNDDSFIYMTSQIISPFYDVDGVVDKELFVGFDDAVFSTLSTEDILALVEGLGMSSCLDRIILQRCADIQRFTQDNVRFNINLSASSMNLGGQFLDDVLEMLSNRVLIPERTIFEITEQTLITNFGDIRSFMEEAKSYGVKFSIDDFGAGFASYDYLCELSFDRLKVDGKYTRQMLNSERVNSFLKSLVYLGSLMHMEVVAEKIETLEQYEHARFLGFDYAQGYYLQKPQPIRL